MKTPFKFLLTFVVLLVCASNAIAQKKLCAAAPPSPFKHNGKISTSFDGATHGMRTTLKHPRIISTSGGGFYLTASFLHQNANSSRNRLALDIALIYTSHHAKYRDAHNLVFLVDGKELPLLGTPALYQTAQEDGMTLEATKVSIPYNALLNMLAARKVSARVGQTEFELTNNHLEALRELASLMAPSPSKWATN